MTKRHLRDLDSIASIPGIAVQVVNILQRADIWRIGDLCSRTEEEVKNVRGVGPGTLQHLRKCLEQCGRHIGDCVALKARAVEWPPPCNTLERLAASWLAKAEALKGVRDYGASPARAACLGECARNILTLAGHVFLRHSRWVWCHLIPLRPRDKKEWMVRFEGGGVCALCGAEEHNAEECPIYGAPRVVSVEEAEEMKRGQ